jgi:hypothetical protein
MFNLEQAIDEWAGALRADGRISERRIEELCDHLRCVIAEVENTGAASEAAFVEALERMGERDKLINEFAKNRTPWMKLCSFEHRFTQRIAALDKRTSTLLTLGSSIFWAALMLLVAWVNRGEESTAVVQLVIVGVWYVFFIAFMPNGKRSAAAEWACLRRKIGLSSGAT